MNVGNSTVVEVHFTLKNQHGELIDSTHNKAPFIYLHGAKDIVEGLEDTLEDLKTGSEFEVIVLPEKGYGIIDPRQITEVPLEDFPEDADLKVGQQFFVDGPEGHQPIHIKKVGVDTAIIDGNHELAGETLYYKGSIVSVREATAAELNHGTIGSSCCSGGICSSES